MEFMSLHFSLNHVASTGAAFSHEHATAIQASLMKLCEENKFTNVYFWGKIYGTENDYYIAYGVGRDFLKDRTYFYSLNHGLEWIQLLEPAPLTMEMTLASTGRFVGNPSALCETEMTANNEDTIDEEGLDEEEEGLWVTFKEEERLSGTVALIQAEAEVIPRGALLKDPSGLVYQNKAFEGLPREEALQLISYFHLRQPEIPWDKNIVGRPDYNLSLDFLNSIANDIPTGCWTIKLDCMETVATVRSLLWPGAYGAVIVRSNRQFHACGWDLASWWYIGTGKKNWDLPFMILPAPRHAKACIVEKDEQAGAEEEEEEEEVGEVDDIPPRFSFQAPGETRPSRTSVRTNSPTKVNKLGKSIDLSGTQNEE